MRSKEHQITAQWITHFVKSSELDHRELTLSSQSNTSNVTNKRTPACRAFQVRTPSIVRHEKQSTALS
jgi:hypothetical protein